MPECTTPVLRHCIFVAVTVCVGSLLAHAGESRLFHLSVPINRENDLFGSFINVLRSRQTKLGPLIGSPRSTKTFFKRVLICCGYVFLFGYIERNGHRLRVNYLFHRSLAF